VVAAAELRELSLRIPIALLSPSMPTKSGIFKTDKDAKAIQIDAGDPKKPCRSGPV
jgi:hypothetical protein